MSRSGQVPRSTDTLFTGAMALVCDREGQLHADERHGLFTADTRVLSTYRFGVQGLTWTLLGRSRGGIDRAQWDFQNPPLHGPVGDVEGGLLHLTVRRRLDGRLRDELRLRSYARRPVRFEMMIQIDADFADLFEVKDDQIRPRLGIRRAPHPGGFTLVYEHEGFHRALRVEVRSPDPPAASGALLVFDLSLPPKGRWDCGIEAVPETGPERAASAHVTSLWPPVTSGEQARVALPPPTLSLDARPLLAQPFRRAVEDLRGLAVPQPGAPPFLAAGVPWFLTLFGRDSLLSALLAGLAGAWPARGALAALAERQAQVRDDWRDAEPGKLPHEIRRGEVAQRGETPHSAYYGTADAPALYCLTLWSAYRWTGDRSLLSDHLPAARAALRWCDELGDRDQDGLQEYATRSSQGYRNQSWEDAEHAIFDEHGDEAEPPVATVELQAYWYAAQLAMADLEDEVGDAPGARGLRLAAAALRRRVEERFWLREQAYYAVALDRRKRPMASITSNPGHLLWCGLPSPERARAVAERLLRPDLFNGWGVRTLSSENPAYDPLAYQQGSVWPHDTMMAAAGLRRFGFRAEAGALIRAALDAAATCEENRPPELFCGMGRDHGDPVPWEKANSPQAWASASMVLAVQLFLGLSPDAPRGRCFLSPWLPAWLPRLAVHDIEIGGESLSVSLVRDESETRIERLDAGALEVVHALGDGPLWGAPSRG